MKHRYVISFRFGGVFLIQQCSSHPSCAPSSAFPSLFLHHCSSALVDSLAFVLWPTFSYPSKDTEAAATLILREITEPSWAGTSDRRKGSKGGEEDGAVSAQKGDRIDGKTTLRCRVPLQPQDLGLTCPITGDSKDDSEVILVKVTPNSKPGLLRLSACQTHQPKPTSLYTLSLWLYLMNYVSPPSELKLKLRSSTG